MAKVWRMDAERFRFLATLDSAPAPLRRVWAMAVYQGRLFAGTLPSGRVCAMEAGTVATWDHAFPPGWRHVAAVRERGPAALRGRRGGRRVARVRRAGGRRDHRPAAHHRLRRQRLLPGRLGDLRLYDRPLGAPEVAALAAR